MRTCAGCGEPINLLRADAVACSARCRMRLKRRGSLPAVMTSRARWVRWSLVGARKPPVTVSGRPASVTDPGTWSSFAEVKASTAGAGMGFVLGEGIGCWDLDHAFIDGKLAGWARDVLDSIESPLFTEVSQSGEGVHVFVEAPEGKGWKVRDGRNIEFYSAGRFIAVTGVPLIR